jgi:hypothetical protein
MVNIHGITLHIMGRGAQPVHSTSYPLVGLNKIMKESKTHTHTDTYMVKNN